MFSINKGITVDREKIWYEKGLGLSSKGLITRQLWWSEVK